MPVQNTSSIAASCTIEFGQFSEKSDISGMPLFGGVGEKCYGGGGVRVVYVDMLVTFFPSESYLGVHLILIKFQLLHPPFIRPWGTILHRDMAISCSFALV